MMRNGFFWMLVILIIGMPSCVSKKKLKMANDALSIKSELLAKCEARNDELEKQLLDLQRLLDESKGKSADYANELDQTYAKIKSLEEQMSLMKSSNNNLLDQLNTLSVVNKTGAESIKKSLEQISAQSQELKDLRKNMNYKDSVNLALVLNLKRSLSDFNDQDVRIEVKKGVVYVSLSDNMLFKSGSATISTSADGVLAKIGSILNDHKDLDILVEGHTDNVPMTGDCVADNWELSARRAVSVVRTLQTKHKVDPSRMTAGGRSEYQPKASNSTPSGKAGNRRTEIIILPKLDQFMKLNELNTKR
jgi:chemotaxis protein MotB